MADWSDGYVSELAYTYGYYRELNPQLAKLAFLHKRLDFPTVRHACELGFGQGISINMHAAASGTEWWGSDFNPTHAAHAQGLASSAGHDRAHLSDEAFAEFVARDDLPQFDFIGLHGIWSWISDDNRRHIQSLLRKHLRPGGVVYISYNTLPGWGGFSAMRELLHGYSERLTAPGSNMAGRINAAIGFAERLLATEPGFAVALPQLADRFRQMKAHNRQYLAHEYFNQDWQPMYFHEVADWLGEAKLQYACSANLMDMFDAINLKPDQQGLLLSVEDEVFRETMRDYMINQQFRRDYWVKGRKELSDSQLHDLSGQLRVLLVSPRERITFKARGALGEGGLQTELYNPVLDILSDHQPYTLEQLRQRLEGQLNMAQLREILVMLVAKNDVVLLQDEEISDACLSSCHALNAELVKRGRDGNQYQTLVSPVIGGGVAVSDYAMKFLHYWDAGIRTAEALAQSVWQQLSARKQKLVRQGQVLESEADNLDELRKQASNFLEQDLPVLQRLRVCKSD